MNTRIQTHKNPPYAVPLTPYGLPIVPKFPACRPTNNLAHSTSTKRQEQTHSSQVNLHISTLTMADHQNEIDTFGNNDDFWIFGYGYAALPKRPSVPRMWQQPNRMNR